MEPWAKRIKQLLDEGRSRGLTQTGLAKACGRSQPSLSQWFNDNDSKPATQMILGDNLIAAAKYLGTTPEWIIDGTASNDWTNGKFRPEIDTTRRIAADNGGSLDQLALVDGSQPNVDPDYANVTGWSQAVGLGAGAEATEYAETHSLKFKKTSLRRRGILGRDLAVYYGRGDSMEPTIQDGDAILFDTSDTRPVDGSLYVIQVDGMANPEYYVKRALVLEAGVYFQSDNPAGDHQWRKPKPMVSKKHPITIIGRVHWVGGWRD